MSEEKALLKRLGNVIHIAKVAKLSVAEIIQHLDGLAKEFKKEEIQTEPETEVKYFKIKVNGEIREVGRITGGFSKHPRYWMIKNNGARKPVRSEYWKIYKVPGMELEAPPCTAKGKEIDLKDLRRKNE